MAHDVDATLIQRRNNVVCPQCVCSFFFETKYMPVQFHRFENIEWNNYFQKSQYCQHTVLCIA